MAGTHSSGRPGGNPGLRKYNYQLKGDKPLNKAVMLRMPQDLYERIRRVFPEDNWQDGFRAKLEEIYEEK